MDGGGLAWAANGGADFPANGGLGRAVDDGGLVPALARPLSRHRRIPSLQLSPVVSGRSTGRWKLAPCQNSERMVASSNAGKKQEQQKTHKTGKNKAGEIGAEVTVFRSAVLSGCAGNEGARRHGESSNI